LATDDNLRRTSTLRSVPALTWPSRDDVEMAATPAVEACELASVAFTLHEYEHRRGVRSYGDEAAAELGVDADRVLKTLIVDLDGELSVAVVTVTDDLDLKRLASVHHVKRAVMSEPKRAERSSGYVVGGISPLGQRTRLSTTVDEAAMIWPTVFVSGGRRGLEIEIAPADLVRICDAQIAKIGRQATAR